ncbi:MAG: hypothetical protein J6J36_04080 [Clostridia bacterium]|nr:hypothetical protein [Clostridia bacterium]
MRKIILYILSIICLIFIIPYFCATRFYTNEEWNLVDEPIEDIKYSKEPHNYSQYGTIKLLDVSTNETSEINLDEYLLRSCVCRNASKLSH